MNYALLDTCVWLTLAPSDKLSKLVDQISDFVKNGQLILLVPEIVKQEFSRNRESVLKSTVSSYRTYLKHARKVTILLEETDRGQLSDLVDMARTRLPDMEESIATSLNKIEDLFNHPRTIALNFSDRDGMEVIQKALDKKAPFHHNKNSVADALLMAQFRNFVADSGRSDQDQFYFLTENTDDFSDTKNKSTHHQDFENIFGQSNVVYSISIGEVLNSISENAVTPEVEQVYQRAAAIYRNLCTDGGPHEVDDESGCWMRSRYGGLTWHVRCKKCGAAFDTGEHWD